MLTRPPDPYTGTPSMTPNGATAPLTITRPDGMLPLPHDLPPEALAAIAATGHPHLQPGGVGVAGVGVPHDAADGPLDGGMPDAGEPPPMADDVKQRLRGIYGDDFPLASDAEPTDAAWVRWVERLWSSADAGVRDRLNEAGRNRLMRAGRQWLSRSSGGSYREPLMPKDTVRPVANQIRPALEWQQQVVTEQRPGFRFNPTSTDADRQRRAEAHQLAVEYQFNQQQMDTVMREIVYWAQTDGVAFLMKFWDPERGPWDEIEPGKGSQPLGDVWRKVYRIEQVRVAPNASATEAPIWWVLCEVLSKQEAVALYGPDGLTGPGESNVNGGAGGVGSAMMTPGLSLVAPQPLLQDQDTVMCYHVFCESNGTLRGGLEIKTCGQKVVLPAQPLTVGRVPIARYTDGSGDPAFFPVARMGEWIAPQQRINMLLSKFYESIRKNTGGSLVVRDASAVTETLVGGLSIIEVDAAGALDGAIMPLTGFSVGADVKEALQFEKKELENRSGWTDSQRGQFSADQSGRAVLAIREQLERIFAPLVDAICTGNETAAELDILWMRHGYQVPRMVAVVGKNRSDLARMLSAADLDGAVDVEIDRETQMPQSRAQRLWDLQEDFSRGVIDVREYRRRRNYANTSDMTTPDDVQEAKALRLVDAIKLGQPPEPMAWQDDEAIIQTVLEKHLILAGGIDPAIRDLASQYWTAYAQQAQQKQTGQMPQGGPPMQGPPQAGGAQPGGPQGGPPAALTHGRAGAPQDPRTQPLAMSHPSGAAASAMQIAEQSDPTLAAHSFEQRAAR